MTRTLTLRTREVVEHAAHVPREGSQEVAVQPAPRDNHAYRFPVSVKGVVIRAGKVVLLRNERDEWELPGGKLEPSESPDVCVVREISEELGLQVQAAVLLDTWVYEIASEVQVLIVTYGCSETAELDAVLSHEHKELAWFPLSEVAGLRMPAGYKASIGSWLARLTTGAGTESTR
jgi:8-oxo-dGTP pyrophosphatase MutT (NUDIX family)